MGEAAGLHVAVLTIGESGATPDDLLVVETLRAAGHHVVSRAAVDNFVPVVRRQLQGWVADANIDVVVVIGGGDDNVASSALAPLVTQPLPGFTNLFRMLVFQTLGSAAILANAEAARCTAKVVFLLPAMADGVRIALEKLIVPQLDSRTEPYNVARLLPRRAPDATGSSGDGPSSPTVGSRPTSSTAPSAPAAARTTPPPFRKTPPAGIVSPGAAPAEPTSEAQPVPQKPPDLPSTPATPVAGAPAGKPAGPGPGPGPGDDHKAIVDIETLGVVVEAEDSGSIRAANTAATSSAPSDKAAPVSPVKLATAAADAAKAPKGKKNSGVVKAIAAAAETERVYVLRSTDSSPRVKMFGPQRPKVGPISKALAALAMLALAAAGGIVLWSRFGPRTRPVSASSTAPVAVDAMVVAVTPPPVVVDAAVPTTDPVGSPPEIDVDPPATDTPRPGEHADRGNDRDRSSRPPTTRPLVPTTAPTGASVDAGVAAIAPPPATPVTPPTPPTTPPATPTTAVSEDGCDEVACVLDQYAKPCCAPFKPKQNAHPGVSDDLDRASVLAGVETMKPVVIRCGETFKAKGQVRVALVVAPDGHVVSSTVDASPDSGLGACVAEALRRVQFKHTVNGGHFTYPYVF